MTKRFALPIAAALSALLPSVSLAEVPANTATAGQVDLDQQVRCAVVFALITREQKTNQPGATRFPPLDEPGKAFFVETGLRLMAERKMTVDDLRPFFTGKLSDLQGEIARAGNPSAATDQAYAQCRPMLEQVIAQAPARAD